MFTYNAENDCRSWFSSPCESTLVFFWQLTSAPYWCLLNGEPRSSCRRKGSIVLKQVPTDSFSSRPGDFIPNVPFDVARLLGCCTSVSNCFQHRGQFLLSSHGWQTSSLSARLTNAKEPQRKINDFVYISDNVCHLQSERFGLRGSWF